MKKRILALALCFMMALSACQQGAQEPPISADLPNLEENAGPVEIPDAAGAPTSGRKFRGFSFAFHRFGRILHLKGLYSQRAFSPLLQFLPQTGFFVLSGVDLFSMKLFKKL